MGSRPPGEQAVEGAGHGTEEGGRHADGRRDPDPVAVARDVLDGDPALLAGDPGPDGPPARRQLRQPGVGGRGSALGPGRDLGRAQVAEPTEQVVDAVERGRLPVVRQRLQAELEVGQGVGVEQLAKLFLAQQLAQEVAIQGERAGPTLGERRVAVVHVGRDVVEQEAAGKRRRPGGLDRVDHDVAPRDAGQDLAQRRDVEHVREAFAVRLDQDREAAVARGDREQVGRPLALLPERRPNAGPPARQQEGSSRVLAESAGEERRARQPADDEILDVLGVGEQQVLDPVERCVALRQPDGDPVVRPDRLDLHAEALADPGLDRQRPWGVDPAAERREQAQPPVAQLVAEALHDDPPVGRERAGRRPLVVEIGEQVVGRPFVEIVALAEPGRRDRAALLAAGQVALELADERPERPPQLDRPADGVAVPERQLAGNARRRADGHPVVADLLDPPAARAQHDHVAVHPGAQLVDHLLVELADPPARACRPRRP